MKKRKRKRKLKKKRFFLTFFIIVIFSCAIYLFTIIPVRNVYISGNTYYKDKDILTLTGINENSSFIFTNTVSIMPKVRKDKLIKSIVIKKNIFLEFEVLVTEKRQLYYDLNSKKIVLEDSSKVDLKNDNVPTLINAVEDKKVYKKFVEKMNKISDDALSNISEIKYNPNDIDKERFLLSMNDGNYVYVTLSKFNKINDYNNISKTLNDKKGILYLDYGNYFLEK